VSAALARDRPPAEAVGKARDLRRRVGELDTRYLARVEETLAPLRARYERHPGRVPRETMLVDIARTWRNTLPARFRLAFTFEEPCKAHHGRITERRLGTATLRVLDDPEWEGLEPQVSINEIAVTAVRGRVVKEARVLCGFSFHALARRYQRGPSALDDVVIADMALVANVAVPDKGSVLIRTDTDGGGWRGVVIANVDPITKTETRMVAVRTWLP
jgi:hypothetical protein